MSKVETTVARTKDFGVTEIQEGQEKAGPNVRAQVVRVNDELTNIIMATQGGNLVMSREEFEAFSVDIRDAIDFVAKEVF